MTTMTEKERLKEMEEELMRLSALYAMTRSKKYQEAYRGLHKSWMHDRRQPTLPGVRGVGR